MTTYERVPISKVEPWEKNPRGIKVADFERLKKQILRLGVYKPLICYKDRGKYIVLGGNMRIRALKDLGIKEVDVSVVEAPTEAKRIEYALSDNDRAGYYEEDRLAELVYPEIQNLDLAEFKVDLGEAIDLKQVVERYGPDIDDGADEVPEIDDTPAITKMGDLFTLGKHRLLCGDSTKAEDVARLMKGEKADMVFTDPPYGIDVVTGNQIGGGGAFGGKKNYKKTIGGDNWVKANRYSPVINDSSTTTARKHYELCRELGVPSFILWGGNYFADFLPPSRGWIAWDKVDGLEGTTKNFSDIELAWTSYDVPARIVRHRWQGLMKGSEKTEKRCHPTQKPIALATECFELFSAPASILDGFLGSGSTLIAAEKTGRVCYGMEIDPKYCDVIIKRYADYVGVSEGSIRKTREKANG